MQTKNTQSKNRKSRAFKFLLSFLLTIIVTTGVAAGSAAALRSAVRPPTVDTHVTIQIPLQQPALAQPSDATSPTAPTLPTDQEIAYYVPEKPTSIMEFETLTLERRPNFYTFLLYGLDEGVNVDTIMVAAYDANTGRGYIISLPRDTRVDVDRRVGLRKLSASYAFGQAQGRGHAMGIERLKDEVATLVGFRPDRYIGVDERAFIRIIDSIGGVNINVPFHMRYDDPYQNLHINLPAGPQLLDGRNALHFSRFRLANAGFRGVTDFERVANQQQVISAAMEELLSPRSILRIPELVSIYREYVATDLSVFEMGWFAEQAPSLTGLYTYTLPMARTERQGWYEIPDKDELLLLINRTVNPFVQDITPEMLRIIQ